MLVELKFGKVTSELLGICQEQYSTSKILNDNYSLQIKGLETDKQILKDLSEDYKQKYLKANEQYVASETSKPSKLTWFGIGFGSALLIGIISAFAVK
jgi:DNA helicase IV